MSCIYCCAMKSAAGGSHRHHGVEPESRKVDAVRVIVASIIDRADEE